MIAMIALLLAVEPAQEAIENQESQVLLYEDANNEEIAVNEECEEADQLIVLEDEVAELSDEAVLSEEDV